MIDLRKCFLQCFFVVLLFMAMPTFAYDMGSGTPDDSGETPDDDDGDGDDKSTVSWEDETYYTDHIPYDAYPQRNKMVTLHQKSPKIYYLSRRAFDSYGDEEGLKDALEQTGLSEGSQKDVLRMQQGGYGGGICTKVCGEGSCVITNFPKEPRSSTLRKNNVACPDNDKACDNICDDPDECTLHVIGCSDKGKYCKLYDDTYKKELEDNDYKMDCSAGNTECVKQCILPKWDEKTGEHTPMTCRMFMIEKVGFFNRQPTKIINYMAGMGGLLKAGQEPLLQCPGLTQPTIAAYLDAFVYGRALYTDGAEEGSGLMRELMRGDAIAVMVLARETNKDNTDLLNAVFAARVISGVFSGFEYMTGSVFSEAHSKARTLIKSDYEREYSSLIGFMAPPRLYWRWKNGNVNKMFGSDRWRAFKHKNHKAVYNNTGLNLFSKRSASAKVLADLDSLGSKVLAYLSARSFIRNYFQKMDDQLLKDANKIAEKHVWSTEEIEEAQDWMAEAYIAYPKLKRTPRNHLEQIEAHIQTAPITPPRIIEYRDLLEQAIEACTVQ